MHRNAKSQPARSYYRIKAAMTIAEARADLDLFGATRSRLHLASLTDRRAAEDEIRHLLFGSVGCDYGNRWVRLERRTVSPRRLASDFRR